MRWLSSLLTSDSVRPFVWLYYGVLLLFGLFAVVFPKATTLISAEFSPIIAQCWVAADIAGTTAAMLGLALRHGGTPYTEMTRLLIRQDWLGLSLQAGGHAAMIPVLMVFEVAAVRSPYFWWVVIAVFAVAAYVVGCTILALQCAFKLRRGRLLIKAARL